MIMPNDGYTAKDGYPYLRQKDFSNVGQKETVTITEGEHVFITANSVFLFQRADVDNSYVSYQMGPIVNNSVNLWVVFAIAFVSFFIVFAVIAGVVIVKRKKVITN